MKIAIIAAGLALAGGLGAAAPAEAQHYGHHGGGGYGRGFHHGGYGGYRGGYGGYRGGYGYRGGGYGYRHHGYGPRYGYGYGYGRGRLVCRYHHGFRRCFRAY